MTRTHLPGSGYYDANAYPCNPLADPGGAVFCVFRGASPDSIYNGVFVKTWLSRNRWASQSFAM